MIALALLLAAAPYTNPPQIRFNQNGTGSVTESASVSIGRIVAIGQYNAKCDGSTDDASALINASADAVAKGKTLLIDCKVRIASAAGTISAPLKFEGAGALDLSPAAGSVTLTGPLSAPLSKIFYTGSGTLTFQALVTNAVPQWWCSPIDGSTDNTSCIQSALNSLGTGGLLFVPPGSYIINGGLTLNSRQSIECASKENTTFSYNGSQSAFIIDSSRNASIRHCGIYLSGSAGSVRGISLFNATAATISVEITDNLIVSTNGSAPVTGQIGISVFAAGSLGLFWNTLRGNMLTGWDIGIQFLGTNGTKEANANFLFGNVTRFCNTGVSFTAWVTDEQIHGHHCDSAGLGTPQTCLIIGDGTNPSNNNQVFGLVSDQGVNGRGLQIKAGSNRNVVWLDNESGQTTIDSGTSTFVFESDVFDAVINLQNATVAGKFTKYNNITTAGIGVAAIYGTPVLLTAQVANLAAQNVYAAAPVGEYRVCATARTTTSGSGTTATLNIIWTDEGGVKTDLVGTWALNSVTVTGQINKCEYIHAVAASNIQVSVTAGTYGTSVYAISATAERLN